MNIKILLAILGFIFLLQNEVRACAPFTTNQIIVGKYNGLMDKIVPEREGKFQFIDYKNTEKLFSKFHIGVGEYYFVDTKRIDLSGFKKGDIIISISDYDDGFHEEYYTIYEMGKVTCSPNNEIKIENREGKIKEFGKKIWTCPSEAPDYILSEKEILKKINERYGICAPFVEVSDIIDGDKEYTVNKVILKDEVLETDIENQDEQSILKEQVIDIVEPTKNDKREKIIDSISENIHNNIDDKESLGKEEEKLPYISIMLFIIVGSSMTFFFIKRVRSK
ncbi:MAG: hypothetical protein GY828_05310 [Candidatus Gracilibacteria bacterium]|nr:hypothetical protein [Candidatus Gracilibacteria bacterium]